MSVLVVYESMFGNTRELAAEIEAGIRSLGIEVRLTPVGQAPHALPPGVDLVIAGGPTHVRGLSRPASRRMAADAAAKPGSAMRLEPGAQDTGLREWLSALPPISVKAAAFATRQSGPQWMTGTAARGIHRRLRRAGASMVVEPRSFLVNNAGRLLGAQRHFAHLWGVEVVRAAGLLPVDASIPAPRAVRRVTGRRTPQ